MITLENITQYLISINSTVKDFVNDNGCVNSTQLIKKILTNIHYSLFCGSFLLVILVFLYVGLEYYKHTKIKKLKELCDLEGIIKLVDNISSSQRIIMFAILAVSAWLLQIAVWGL